MEEFDITLSDSVNLEQAFTALENEIGDFVVSEDPDEPGIVVLGKQTANQRVCGPATGRPALTQ